jgi:hypothetical protein
VSRGLVQNLLLEHSEETSLQFSESASTSNGIYLYIQQEKVGFFLNKKKKKKKKRKEKERQSERKKEIFHQRKLYEDLYW